MEARQGLFCACEGAHFGAFDVHLDEIHARQLQLGDEVVDGGERHVGDGLGAGAMNDEAIGGLVIRIDQQVEEILFVPDAFGHEDDAAGGDLLREIAAQTLEVVGRGLDGDDLFRAGAQGGADEHADVGAAIEDDIAFTDGAWAGAVNVRELLGDVEGQDIQAVGGSPVVAIGRGVVLETVALLLDQPRLAQDIVLDLGYIFLVARDVEGAGQRAAMSMAGENQNGVSRRRDEQGQRDDGDKKDEESNSFHKGQRIRSEALAARRKTWGDILTSMDVVTGHSGWIEVICGPMFSGKSEELIRRLRRAVIARRRVQVFKPAIDVRYSPNEIVSHADTRMSSEVVGDASQILERTDARTQVVGIDEANFLGPALIDVVERLADGGKQVIIAGLDTDYMGRPFEPLPELLCRAESITKTLAVCMRCGNPAKHTQRLYESDDLILVGAAGMYEARCRRCFEPGIPKQEYLEFARPARKSGARGPETGDP